MKKFSDFCDNKESHLTGDRVSITELYGKEIVFISFKNILVNGDEKLLVQFAYEENGKNYVFITKSQVIRDKLQRYKDELPFAGTLSIVKNYVTIL